MNLMLKNLCGSIEVNSSQDFSLLKTSEDDSSFTYSNSEIEIIIEGITPKMVNKIMMGGIAGFVLQQTGDEMAMQYKVVTVLNKQASVKGSL